jgi:hypothetical protein
MYRTLFSSTLFSIGCLAAAQSYVHQVVVLNEGHFDWGTGQQTIPVSLGSYDPSTGSYSTVATVEGSRFGSDVMVEGQYIYVAADQKLLKYDKDSYELVDEAAVTGIRKIAFWNDLILLTRGELGGLSHYFEVRNAVDLELVEAITPAEGLPHSAEDVVVADDKAWLAVNNAFDWSNITGYIARIDLQTMTVLSPIDLGSGGLNPEKIMVTDGSIYVLNNTDFTGSSISRIGRQSGNLQYTDQVAFNSGCGASALAENVEKIYFMEYAVNSLARFDLTMDAVADTLQNNMGVYGLIEDPINGVLYATTTDFENSGELHVMQFDGTVNNTVAVGVSPGHLALDVRLSTGIDPIDEEAFEVFPNPAVDQLRINGLTGEFIIMDALGRSVYSGSSTTSNLSIDVSGLRAGIYTINSVGGQTVRFSKAM